MMGERKFIWGWEIIKILSSYGRELLIMPKKETLRNLNSVSIDLSMSMEWREVEGLDIQISF